jgi:16S rRNA (guanine527-N7)-methyltransferase
MKAPRDSRGAFIVSGYHYDARSMDAAPSDADLLCHDGLLAVLGRAKGLGFLGPGDVADHISHALRFLPLVDACSSDLVGPCVDLGTGAGVPGLILAMARPATTWFLVDSMVRRTTVLNEAVTALKLGPRVRVWTGRAEDFGRISEHRSRSAIVVARSFGPPAVIAECAAALLIPDGHLLVSEPPNSTGERWPADGLAKLGLTREILQAGIMSLRKTSSTPERYPRKAGLPGKRPLF